MNYPDWSCIKWKKRLLIGLPGLPLFLPRFILIQDIATHSSSYLEHKVKNPKFMVCSLTQHTRHMNLTINWCVCPMVGEAILYWVLRSPTHGTQSKPDYGSPQMDQKFFMTINNFQVIVLLFHGLINLVFHTTVVFYSSLCHGFIFWDNLQPNNSVFFIKKPHNNELIFKLFKGLPILITFTGIWFCRTLE